MQGGKRPQIKRKLEIMPQHLSRLFGDAQILKQLKENRVACN